MRRFDQINVIPMIDVMLVLLAIVLTTASFIVQNRLNIDLPPAEQTESPSEAALEIAIDRSDNFYIGEKSAAFEALRKRLSETDRNTPITLRVDGEVRFARFVQVIDLLKANRLERVTILTRKPT